MGPYIEANRMDITKFTQTTRREKIVDKKYEWLIDWNVSHWNCPVEMINSIERVAYLVCVRYLIEQFPNKVTQVSISLLRFYSLSPIDYDVVSLFYTIDCYYSLRVIQRDVYAFSKAANGLRCNKKRTEKLNKNDGASITPLAMRGFFPAIFHNHLVLFIFLTSFFPFEFLPFKRSTFFITS